MDKYPIRNKSFIQNHHYNRQQGQVLLLIVMIIALVITLLSVVLSNTNNSFTKVTQTKIQTLQTAESILNRAFKSGVIGTFSNIYTAATTQETSKIPGDTINIGPDEIITLYGCEYDMQYGTINQCSSNKQVSIMKEGDVEIVELTNTNNITYTNTFRLETQETKYSGAPTVLFITNKSSNTNVIQLHNFPPQEKSLSLSVVSKDGVKTKTNSTQSYPQTTIPIETTL